MVDPESREPDADGLLLVGRVARPHGIRGHVVVNPETDFMEDRFRAGRVLLVGPADRTREHEILESRFHQGRPIVRFAGVDTMSDAETLSGADLWLRERELEPLPDGTFYRHDLVGCEVVDTHGTVVGTVTAVEGSLDRSYLVVDEHMLIPLVGEICVAVEIASRRVTVDPPEGLIDLNRPGRRR
ncbi:MAG: ribosome maturation factor RimM [Vicinamibacterales bacterium]